MNKEISREQHLDLYYYMRLTRATEETLITLFRLNKIVGGVYPGRGQEAVSVGTAYALEKKDWMAPMIRNIGSLLAKGVQPRDILTQHMAKYTSRPRGKDGVAHIGDLALRIVSPISMLGDSIPVMAGMAIGGRYLGQNIVTMTYIGDGGSSTGVFHEGLNFAAAQRAPFVLVLENNQWAYSTPISRQVPLENFADRAKAYGIPSYTVDGNDVMEVFATAREAVERCRAGEGPILLEAKTMRMQGHAQHDPAEYVPKSMFEHWKGRDPIERYENFLLREGILTAAAKKEMEGKIKALLEEEREFAESSPLPPPEFAAEGVYCNGDHCHKIEAKWQRPLAEVTPPKCSVEPIWMVEGFGKGKGTGAGKQSAIHFGDTPAATEKKAMEEKLAPKSAAKTVVAKASEKKSKKPVKAAPSKAAARKAAR